jgi:hypothetical protein
LQLIAFKKPETDEQIMELLRSEHTFERGFRLLMAQYRERLYWHIRRMVQVHDDADDVLQNTFIKVYRGIAQLEGKSKRLEVEASSAGDVDAYELSSEIVDANASSGASVKVNVLKEIDGHASSGGSIKYRGTPSRTNTGSSSGGSVKKSN